MRVEGSMNYVLDISAAEGEFGVENWINYVLEKLREIGRAMSPEEWINFVREKLKEFLAVLEHFGKIFMAKVDEVFPPETRVEQLKHWAQVAAPYIVAAAAFLILLRYFSGCCCLVGRGVGSVGRGVGSGVKTMIAPGTGGAVRILRAPFEANPASYFRGREREREREREVGPAENSVNHVLKNLMETERDMGAEEWINYIVEKLKEWLIGMGDFGGSLIKKPDEVFPPESTGEQLKHWHLVATPFIIGAVVMITCLCCCSGTGSGERAVRMMKAPGRYYRMPRHVFEGNPRSYFRNLSGNTSVDELV
ncbi:hypothetical protein RHSIM_Rhsim09G0124100 [Rhododendron simsii]|uniref:Uncharacterized protein n=1 Tax=Rhododendron simsii TaxID=118357 RepID=A0A834GGN7_RHOSS|nr:hypothetical protein RHSIM_Rhsim09G0124100 [Rhododendron simsii]